MLSHTEVLSSQTDEIRETIRAELYKRNDIEPNAFEITERALFRKGDPCGIYFCLHGPRNVKFTAIWETAGNTVLFYDCNGERMDKLTLAQPALRANAA